MKRSFWLVVAGFLISLVLMAWVFVRLDWGAFFTALKQVRPAWLALAGGIIITSIMLRALRWNLISNVSVGQYWNFWRATSLGYLGNLIYPARAGEVLRMAAISQLAGVPAAKAVTSAVVDRVADGLMLGLFMVIVLITHGPRGPGAWVLISVAGIFVVVALGLAAISLRGE